MGRDSPFGTVDRPGSSVWSSIEADTGTFSGNSFLCNMVCYVHSLKVAHEWLGVTTASLHATHPVALLMPLGFAVEIFLAMYFILRPEKII